MADNGAQRLYIEEANLKANTTLTRVSKPELNVARFLAVEKSTSVRAVFDEAIRELRNKTPNPLHVAQTHESKQYEINEHGDLI